MVAQSPGTQNQYLGSLMVQILAQIWDSHDIKDQDQILFIKLFDISPPTSSRGHAKSIIYIFILLHFMSFRCFRISQVCVCVFKTVTSSHPSK